MSKQDAVKRMIAVVEYIERENQREKFDSEKTYKTNVVNIIIEELDKVMDDEN